MSAPESSAAGAAAPAKKRVAPSADSADPKRSRAEPAAPEPELCLAMNDTARALRTAAASFAGAGLAALKIIDDPQSQFLVMITSNAKKSSEANLEKGNNFCVVNFVVLKALKAGFSNTPYEVRACVCARGPDPRCARGPDSRCALRSPRTRPRRSACTPTRTASTSRSP